MTERTITVRVDGFIPVAAGLLLFGLLLAFWPPQPPSRWLSYGGC